MVKLENTYAHDKGLISEVLNVDTEELANKVWLAAKDSDTYKEAAVKLYSTSSEQEILALIITAIQALLDA